MKKFFVAVFSICLALVTLGTNLTVQASERVYNRTDYYIDDRTLPAQEVLIGKTGRIRPKQDSVLKDFDYAFLYSTSDSSILSIDEKGNWVAHGTGTVSITVRQHSMDSVTPAFQEEFDRYGLSWYNPGVADPGLPSAEATVKVTVVDLPVSPMPIEYSNVYRLYHPGLQVHLYTKDKHENAVLARRGWKAEGIAWQSQEEFGEPVYRLYHSGLKIHLYTKDPNEYQILAGRGWRQEGEAYRSSGSTPVYRLYHPGIKKHLFTKDQHEKNVLSQRGWKYEGIAWYVY